MQLQSDNDMLEFLNSISSDLNLNSSSFSSTFQNYHFPSSFTSFSSSSLPSLPSTTATTTTTTTTHLPSLPSSHSNPDLLNSLPFHELSFYNSNLFEKVDWNNNGNLNKNQNNNKVNKQTNVTHTPLANNNSLIYINNEEFEDNDEYNPQYEQDNNLNYIQTNYSFINSDSNNNLNIVDSNTNDYNLKNQLSIEKALNEFKRNKALLKLSSNDFESNTFNGDIFSKETFTTLSLDSKYASLDDLTSATPVTPTNRLPYLLAMPTMPSEEDCPGESFHSGDITNLFQTIPSNSWILPYILVGAVTLAKENENKETLCAHSDVRLKSRVLNDVQVTADSTTSSNNHTPTPNSPAIISDIDNEPELSDDNYGDCDDDELDAVCHDHEVKHKHHNKHHHNNNNNQEHEHEHSNEDNHHDEYHHSEEPHTQKKKKHHGIKSLFHRKKKHHDEINEDHGSDDQGHRHHSEDHSHKDKEKHKHHGIGHFFHRKHKHHSDHIEGGSGHGSGNDSNDPHNSNSATPNNETDSDHVNEDQTRHKSHSTASIFNSLIHKKKPPKPNDINKSVHGDLVISFDDNGVYVANKPERSSSTNLENSDSEQSISNLPKFMQHLFFFPNFQKLGVVFIRRSIENTWERRNLYLWDNYLFETLVGSDDHLPLGFANLSGGSINLKFDKKSQSKSF